jgi:hypothetical protein
VKPNNTKSTIYINYFILTHNLMSSKNELLKNNIIPLILAVLVLIILSIIYYGEITLLNSLPIVTEKIATNIRRTDVWVWLLIYLKTSIDFAIFIGILMKQYPWIKNRYAIEIGTWVGNMLWTAIVLAIWVFFKEVSLLLGIMVLLASLVLFEMAAGSIEHLFETDEDDTDSVAVSPLHIKIAHWLLALIKPILYVISPVLSKVMPKMSHKADNSTLKKTFWWLFMVSFSIPFILWLDDFAGYVPFFKVVNVFGFGLGIFLGHCILNIALFISPTTTIKAIKNPTIALLWCIAFIGLGGYGLYEAIKIIFIGH